MLRKKPALLIASLLVIALAGVSMAALAASGSTPFATPGTTVGDPTPQTVEATTDLTGAPPASYRSSTATPAWTAGSSFGLLRRPRRAEDEMTPEAASGVVALGVGANPALSRLLFVASSGRRYFLVPGAKVTCIVDDRGGSGCGTEEAFERGEMVGAVECAPGREGVSSLVYGVVPDGVGTIQVNLVDGGSTTTQVTGNAYAVSLPEGSAQAASIEWTGPHGNHQQVVPRSPDAGARCSS